MSIRDEHLPEIKEMHSRNEGADRAVEILPPSSTYQAVVDKMAPFEGAESMPIIGETSSQAASSFAQTALWSIRFEMEPVRGLGHHPSTHQGFSQSSVDESLHELHASTTLSSTDAVRIDAQQARERAMEIIRKFQATSSASATTHDRPHRQYGTNEPDSNDTSNPHHIGRLAVAAAADHGFLRRECLARLEERKRLSLLKNLEYVARVEDGRLRHQLEQLEQARIYQNQMDEQYRRRVQSDDGRQSVSQAGIGTQPRQRLEKKRKLETPFGDVSTASSSSVAIYVSNLPADGSADEQVMTSLFGSYGSLRKIHFYLNKNTGRLKGDALVIYSLQQGQDQTSFTQAVCSQVGENIRSQFMRTKSPYHAVADVPVWLHRIAAFGYRYYFTVRTELFLNMLHNPKRYVR